MVSFILWYLLITLVGLLAFPLIYKLLPGLADRGYSLARTLGWLVWGYLFWILGSLGLLQNDIGGQLFALILLAALGLWAWRTLDGGELRKWLRQQRRMILIVEVLFMAAFAGWTIVRAANPEITGTEKPMELAFINAILRSPTLPPNDPWLSGYSISYYHFGYILVAMLARLTATPGGVAFNLGLSLVFGLSAIGSYGVLYNLLAAWQGDRQSSKPRHQSPFSALLAPFFVLIVSNLSGLLHVLRVNGIFWRQTETGEWVSPFWAWLDIGRFSEPPTGETFQFWWWWQGSRIVQDYDFLGNNKGDIIDEFPFFSFLLGDLHPHVLAMPFAFLAMALALNLLLGGSRGKISWLGIHLTLNWPKFVLAAFALGAMGFLNTWDWPFYVALFAGVYVFMRLRDRSAKDPEWQPSFLRVAGDFFGLGLALGVTGGLMYLPFYISFSSQAGGLIPNLIYITKGAYTWIQFAPLWIPLFALVFYLWKRDGNRQQLMTGLKVTLILLVIMLAVMVLLTALITVLHVFQGVNSEAAIAASAFLATLQAPGWRELILEGFTRRLTIPGTLLSLVILQVFVIALVWPRRDRQNDAQTYSFPATSHAFTLLLILLGILLVLAPEFFFLRDFFGYRINTIFKFYFLAWLLWSIAAAYGTHVVWTRLASIWGVVFKAITLIVLSLALLYPIMGTWSKANGFNPDQWDLDGTAHIERFNPDESAAMQWLWQAPLGVIAESVGGSYSGHARFSTHSGQPTVLGWIGHEHQWRGGFEEMGSRESDIQRLYCAPNWPETQTIIDQYGIRYIVIGNMERITYDIGTRNCPSGVNEAKFIRYLEPVFNQGSVTIYAVP